MTREPTTKNWHEVSVALNPTGRMLAEWRAPRETRAPYPDDLPISERTTWDLKSEAEVNLAKKIRTLNKNFTPARCQLWDAWWLLRDQADGGN